APFLGRAGGGAGVHRAERGGSAHHAQPNLPRLGSLGTLRRGHQLELGVWLCRGMGLGTCARRAAVGACPRLTSKQERSRRGVARRPVLPALGFAASPRDLTLTVCSPG